MDQQQKYVFEIINIFYFLLFFPPSGSVAQLNGQLHLTYSVIITFDILNLSV